DKESVEKGRGAARVVRTRSDAAALAAGGYVRINGRRIDEPGRPVRPGDVVTVALDRTVRVLKVVAFAERRGSAADARALCEALDPSGGHSPARMQGEEAG